MVSGLLQCIIYTTKSNPKRRNPLVYKGFSYFYFKQSDKVRKIGFISFEFNIIYTHNSYPYNDRMVRIIRFLYN